MKRIRIDDDILQQLLGSHAVDLNESPSDILRRELGLAPPPDTIEIDDDVYRFLVSKAVSSSESPSSILRALKLGEDHGQPAPAVVEFHIPAGAGGSPWNTRETAVAATVGNILRIFNDDFAAHRPHTAGAPFPHPSVDISPGQSMDFVLTAPFDSAASGPLSDHNFGLAAQFFINVRPAA